MGKVDIEPTNQAQGNVFLKTDVHFCGQWTRQSNGRSQTALTETRQWVLRCQVLERGDGRRATCRTVP
jgi:hypothetical protein